MNSGVGTKVKHVYDDNVRDILLGLAKGGNLYTKDGMPLAFMSHAKEHIITFIRSVFPEGVQISGMFPHFTFDENGNLTGELQLPYVAVKISRGPMREVGIGRLLWDGVEGTVYGFNQVCYIEFDIFGRSDMKIDQIADQIELQLQMEKGTGGELWQKGFQNFMTRASEHGRGFRYDTAWDFRMQHQYSFLFHARLVISTSFDVAWVDKIGSYGVISQIIFGQTVDIPWETIIGSSLAYLRLEELYWGWHGETLL